MRIAIFPARSGSKRIKNKKIIYFHNSPMIAHPLKAALDSKLFDEIHVSTDSDEVKKVVEDLGVEVKFKRPKSISDDDTPVIEVARWVLEKYKTLRKDFESFAMIMPCSPLLTSDDLVNAYEIYDQYNGKYPVLSVSKFPCPIEWAFEEVEKDVISPSDKKLITKKGQELKERYYDTGTFSIQNSKIVLGNTKIVNDCFFKYELPFIRAIDIDTYDDLETASQVYTLLNKGC